MARRGENIYKRKDGRWEGRYRTGFDAAGKPKYRSIYAKTYHEVKSKLSVLKINPIQYTSSGNLTVKELFTDWLDAVRRRVKESTYANYRMKFEKHIFPSFGGYAYDKLNAKAVYTFIEQKIRTGLSVKYVADIIVVFKSACKYVSKEYGYNNPLLNVMLPKAEKKEMHLFSEQQQLLLCQHLMSDVDFTKLGVLLSYYTGIRIGELCALKWSDFDFERGVLYIKRTVQRISETYNKRSTRILIDVPKSKSSIRSIPLPSFLLSFLKKYNRSTTNYLLSGTEKVIEPRTMQYRFKALLKKAELPSINFHSLRHMFATNCVKLGFDIKTLSELLGHSSVDTTLNRYVHSSLERKKACMDLLTAIV